MTRRIVAAVGRALSPRPIAESIDRPHFHQGAQGNPAPCFEARCESPRLHL